MKIGVFGGTFDPVHTGHLRVAEAAAETLGLDQVRLIPTAIQPFKRDLRVADARHRLAMLAAAVADRPRLVVDDREVRRGGVSYTIDTLRSLHADFPDDQLFLLVGADAARDLPAWRGADRFPDFCAVIRLTRPGVEADPGTGIGVEVPAVDISSTHVRELIGTGGPFRETVPAAVADYIDAHELYR